MLIYRWDENWSYTAKVFKCTAFDLLPQPIIGDFDTHHYRLLDRYT
jgi:hypothetical protein